jgi:DNA-binding winged helix-turn-helix (wHTH) protein/Flp pilus assembly protein TadD
LDKKLRHLYEFGAFRLDATERLLLREGEAVQLTPKAFELLLALVEQPGHLLEKETLLKTVWPDTIVEENNLADNISRLRKALGEGEHGQKFIETVPKRGYRFSAGVKRLDGESDALVVPVLPPPYVAVKLPTAPQPDQTAASLRLRQRPEVFIIACAFVVLTLISAALYWRSQRESAEVQRLEFKGNFYLSRWTEDEVREGLAYYQHAVALAPDSASAYDGLTTAWMFLSDVYVSPREAMPKAEAANANALQRDEAFVPARVSLGLIKLQYEWDWAGAEREFQRAIRLDPQNALAHQLHGWYLISVSRFAEAQAEMKRVVDAEPVDGLNLWNLGLSFYFARDYEQAVEQYRRSLGVAPKSHWAHFLLGWAYEQQGKFAEALAELNQADRLDDNPQVLASLGHVYALSGQRAQAQKVIEDLKSAKYRYVSPYDVATIHAGLEQKDEAMAWLEKAYEDRSGWLALWLKVDPKFDGLRADPRFQKLLQRVGLAPSGSD